MSENYFYIDGKKIPMSEETAKSILDSQKKKTYEDIAKELMSGGCYYVNSDGGISHWIPNYEYLNQPDNAPSKKQLESILALNMLCNVAKYLNGDYKFNCTSGHIYNYYIYLNRDTGLDISYDTWHKSGNVYFKSEKLAEEAIEILGADAIKKALTLNH